MKLYILILTIITFSLSCKQEVQELENKDFIYFYPIFEAKEYNRTFIEKIELKENRTIVYLKHYTTGWAKINGNTYLKIKGDTTKLKLIKAIGIPISPNKHTSKKTGEELNFKLEFPRVKNNQNIDLIECEKDSSCFNFYNISLSSDKKSSIRTIYYDENLAVVNIENAKYYSIFQRDKKGEIIDDIRMYNLETNTLKRKYKCYYISMLSAWYDIVDGDDLNYDKYGNIIKKTIRKNPEKIRFLEYIEQNNDIVYNFNKSGNLYEYSEYNNSNKIISIKYNSNQEIIYASDLRRNEFYEGSPTLGYDLILTDEFKGENVFNALERNTENGRVKLTQNGLLIESDNNGGISNNYDIDFDMNNSDWVISTMINRIGNIEGAGIIIGTDNQVSNCQMFLISGDSYFNYYNIFNGFNISHLKDWMYVSSIRNNKSKNELYIMKLNDMIYVSVNGVTIFKTEFTKVKANNISLFVDKVGNKIKFENLTIKKLNCELPSTFYNPKTYTSSNDEFKGNGSGFLVNSEGYISTNYHVIEGAKKIVVVIDNKDYECNIIDIDKENDLALLKILSNKTFTTYSSINSNKVETASEVFVLGYPYALSLLGNEIKMTDGKISSQTGFRGDEKTYQISAPIQPGNSGGPLFNIDGDVIGIVNAKFTQGENVGYAIKTRYLLSLLKKNEIDYGLNNSIKNLSLVEKVKLLSKTTLLIKVK